MDVTTSKLITVCYAVFALIMCTVGYFFYRSQQEAFRPPQLEVAASTPGRPPTGSGAEAVSRRLKFELERQRERIDELQAVLNKRDRVMRLQASQLRSNSENYEKLQREADEYLDLLFDVIQSSQLRVDSLARIDAEDGRRGERPDTTEDADTLRIALEASQWELEEALASVQLTEETATDAQTRLAAFREAIVGLGGISVPTLIGLLDDPQPETRGWAATALGRLGDTANGAIEALRVAEEDSDLAVRSAATAAIQEISESW